MDNEGAGERVEPLSVVTAGLLAAAVPHDLLAAQLSRAEHAARVRQQAAAVSASPVFWLAVLAKRKTLSRQRDDEPEPPASLREADAAVRRHIAELADLADMDAETTFKIVYVLGAFGRPALGEVGGGVLPSGRLQLWRERGARQKRSDVSDTVVAMQLRWIKRAGLIHTYYRAHDVEQPNLIHRIDRIERDIPPALLPDRSIPSQRKALQALSLCLERPDLSLSAMMAEITTSAEASIDPHLG